MCAKTPEVHTLAEASISQSAYVVRNEATGEQESDLVGGHKDLKLVGCPGVTYSFILVTFV